MNDQIDEIRAEIGLGKIERSILGVADAADETEIKKYWLLAMENHPDLNPHNKERVNRFKWWMMTFF